MKKPYKIDVDVGDDKIIKIDGFINPRYYRNKASQQIWMALYNTARQLVEAWENYYNE